MALQLKTTGLATALEACVVVDDNGQIVDLTGKALTVHANVTTGSSTWKGVSRRYFLTSGDGAAYSAYNVKWVDTPSTNGANGGESSVFVAFAGAGPGGGLSNGKRSIVSSGYLSGLLKSTGAGAIWGTGDATPGNTAWPTDGTTKFSAGGNYRASDTNEVFYGLESGALASDGGPFSTGNYAIGSLTTIGGWGGQGFFDGKFHIVAVFNRKLTTAEFQSLHNDWYGTLIQSAGASIVLSPDPASVTVGGTAQITITRNNPAPAGAGATYNLVSGTPAVATVPATVNMAAGQTTATFNVTGVSTGSGITITATNAADSGETDTMTVNVVTVRKLRLLAHIDALGATAVKGAVFAAPTGGALVGAKIGEFTGGAFKAVAESGQAPLEVAVGDFGGSALTTADTPVCVWEGTSAATSALGNAVAIGSVGPHECTVIEV